MRFLPRRALGRTGFVATQLGIGDLADRALGLEACAATLRRALDAGLNLVDTAPAYEDGFSEQVVGRALFGRRDGLFVIDKVDHLDRPVASQVERSLDRLGLRPDAFVFHRVASLDEWERLTAPGGGMDQLAEEVRRGSCRFRGISSHHPDVARAAILSGACDLILFPVGPFVDERYLTDVLPLARARGVGAVCFKTFAAGMLVADTAGYGRPIPEESRGVKLAPKLSIRDCLAFTLTLDPDVALLGLSTPAEQEAAFAAAEEARPLSAASLDDIRCRATQAVRGKGPTWWNPAD
jgi:aryl-alcohol dehydrogenase-like predicted oxidoreductase